MYFKEFPRFLYDFKYGNETKTSVVVDVTRNVRFRKEIFANVAFYDEYDVIDGETPEIIAEKLYGNPEYHWILMIANGKYDYLEDFPLSEPSLVRVIASKYTNPSAIHHYENADGFVVNSTAPGAVSVSNEQYEREKNESKRRIKIISPQLVNTILKNFKEQL